MALLKMWILLAFSCSCFLLRPSTATASAQGVFTTAVGVARALVDTFATDEESTKDLTAAEETIRGLTFNKFNERVSCKVMRGVELANFEIVIDGIAMRLELPAKVKNSILEGKYAQDNHEVIIDFKFSTGEDGSFTYGRIATVKRSDGATTVMDVAYSVYNLVFKLSPTVIEHEKKQKFLGFTLGKEVWQEKVDRNTISQQRQEHMRIYFLFKAIQGFRREYSGLLQLDSCASEGC